MKNKNYHFKNLILFDVSFKITLLSSIFGAIISLAYLIITDNVYEAKASIPMARIYNSNLLPVNVEDPVSLVERMTFMVGGRDQITSDCNFGPTTKSKGAIKFTTQNGANSLVFLKVTGSSPGYVRSCTEALIDYILRSQESMMLSKTNETALKENKLKQRLAEDKILLKKIEQSGLPPPSYYYSLVVQSRALEDDLDSLMRVKGDKEPYWQSALLTSPVVDVSSTPISPNKPLVLIVGAFGGFLLGLLLAKAWRSLAEINYDNR